jgi:two-component system cell cycle sensor histidine kinase/response regulator CckA
MHILHLEVNIGDVELAKALLRSRWPDCTITALATREDYEAAVHGGDFDLILSDYSLPQYSGLEALAYARIHRPEKPFLYLSGTIGDERAIEALKRGATDYVLKEHPARLVSAISAALAQIEQIEARRRGEERIREQASLLDKAREPIYVADAEGRLTYWNASAERLYGWSSREAVGCKLREMLYSDAPASFDTAYALVLASGEWRGELTPKPRHGASALVESYWSLVMDGSGRAKTILIIDAEITEKRRMENQLLQSRRLETLGLLVGGIAHDLNNVLSPIQTVAELLQLRLTCAEDRELLDILDAGARHGVELVSQLVAFASGKGEKRSQLAIDSLICSVRKLMGSIMPSNIETRVSLECELWPVSADATQLRQVLVNLCLNARDAMPNGGVIEIRARNVLVDPAARSVQGEVRPGPHVCITVADTGVGIPPEMISKIFDPFFTTKQAGKGTGLGLANVAVIITSHEGFLGVESTPDVGTAFHVHIPALDPKTTTVSDVVVPGVRMNVTVH